ncbi:MAG: glycine-rich protein [Sporichthyaceae bacterium]
MTISLGRRVRPLACCSIGVFATTLATTGLLALSAEPAAAVTCAPNGSVQQCFFTDTTTPEQFVIPAGVRRLETVYLRGADGGDTADNIRRDVVPGGLGGETNARNVPVTPGDTITFYIGAVGAPGTCRQGGSLAAAAGGRSSGLAPTGAGRGGAGGDGGPMQQIAQGCSGGGGGAGTFMMAGSDVPGAAAPIMAAGGGGGAGGTPEQLEIPANGGRGGGDANSQNGRDGAFGGRSGDNGGGGGVAPVANGDASNRSNGGDGADSNSYSGGGGGGGYCGGGGGAHGPVPGPIPTGAGGGGGSGFDFGDSASANPCSGSPSPYTTASAPGQPGSAERTERATGLTPGVAVITFRIRPTAKKPGGKAQCNNDPGKDPANDPRTRKCQDKRKGGPRDTAFDVERVAEQTSRKLTGRSEHAEMQN